MTEQGETIAQKYANLITATYNLELLVANTLRVSLSPEKQIESPRLAEICDGLASNSRKAYRALVDHHDFVQFFRQATPIDILEHSNIGSRPSRRTGAGSVEDLRAIPWVFSWCQARFFLPGWYGAGTALSSLSGEDFEFLSQHAQSDSFLKYSLTNIETSLASASLELMRLYSSLVQEENIRETLLSLIIKEFNLSNEQIKKLMHGSLIEKRPRLERTLVMRASALKTLHERQVALLRNWRSMGSPKEETAELLQVVNAIAAGLRTTG